MVKIGEASQEIAVIIKKHLFDLKKIYSKVELTNNTNGASLACLMENNETITLRIIPDDERRSINPPQTSRDYQTQGGHKSLIDKFKAHNPEAWKIQVKKTIGNNVIEIGFYGNEDNWNAKDFEKSFINIMLNN